ncbi:MAG: hypothetical protein ACOCVN_01510, partial [bacterium]
LYNNQLKKNYEEILYAFIPSSIIIVLFSVSLSYFFQTYQFPRSVFLIVLPVMIPLMVVWRYFTLKLEKKFSRAEDIVVIGQGEEAIKLVNNIKRLQTASYEG